MAALLRQGACARRRAPRRQTPCGRWPGRGISPFTCSQSDPLHLIFREALLGAVVRLDGSGTPCAAISCGCSRAAVGEVGGNPGGAKSVVAPIGERAFLVFTVLLKNRLT